MEGMGRKGQKKRRLTFTGLDRLTRLDGKDKEGIGLLTIPLSPYFVSFRDWEDRQRKENRLMNYFIYTLPKLTLSYKIENFLHKGI